MVAERSKYTLRNSSSLDIVPYVLDGNRWTIPDPVWVKIWNTMLENHLVEKVFYSGEVVSEFDFMSLVKSSGNVIHTIWCGSDCLMIAWLNNFGANYAMAHFCCFPPSWGKRTVEMGRMTLSYWFGFRKEGKPVLDVVVGRTPDNNRAALIYLRRIGMKVLGTIPYVEWDSYENRHVGGVMSYMTREGMK